MAGRASRGAVAAELARDALTLCGAGLISYGSWLVYPPAGFIIGGAILLLFGLVGALRGRPAASKAEG